MKKIIFSMILLQAMSLNVLADNDKNVSSRNEEGVEDLNRSKSNLTSYFWAQGASPRKDNRGGGGSSVGITNVSDPLMVSHGGGVMSTVNTTLIFWGKSWAQPTFVSDKIAGLNSFYNNYQASTYTKTVSEYLPKPLSHFLVNQNMDTLTVASSDTNKVLAEVCKLAGSNVSSNGTGYYAVYSDIKRGSASYCAYHSGGMCGGKPVQFGFFFNLDGDTSCDPQSPYAPPVNKVGAQNPGYILPKTVSVYAQSQGLAALASVSAHEISETITDPISFSANGSQTWGGWYDASGAENGDKCAWTFGPSKVDPTKPGTVLFGTIPWKLQGEWSNAAQKAGTGYLSNGLKGCVSGS